MSIPRNRDLATMLEQELQNLKGSECWSVIGGKGTGSVISLDFGRRIPRPRPLTNPTLTDEQKTYTGEFALYIECAWRIHRGSEVLCGHLDDNDSEGSMLSVLDALQGKRMESVEVASSTFDLSLRFSSGHVLQLFCDQTVPEDGGDNYSFFSPEGAYVVGQSSKVRREAHEQSQ